MRDQRAGFTLIELLIVVLIMAILAAAGVPQYRKLMETSRADEAGATVQAIAAAQQSYAFHHNRTYLTGDFPSSTCGATSTGACALVFRQYLGDRDWGSAPYTFTVCNAAAAGACNGFGASDNNLAAAVRKAGPPTPYSDWGYRVTINGTLLKKNGDEP